MSVAFIELNDVWKRCGLLDFRHDSLDTMSLRELVFQSYHIPIKNTDLLFGTKYNHINISRF